ncbi:MAG: hypothetical protein JEY96_04740 [Bacteroidales bacterium]|nr:hypothetical protein [Bacteroidales bacterium]
MKLKIKTILSFLLILFSINGFTQNPIINKTKEDKKGDFKPYLFTGGSLWMGFGSYTYIDVNLVFGSQVTERINIGLSGKYQYLNDKRSISGNFETSVYGGSVFSQIALIKDFRNILKVKGHSGIIAHLEYEFLNTEYNYIYFNDSDSDLSRYWLHNVLVGGGYFQQMGRKAKSYIILLWNLNPNEKNPYTYPQLRVGFSISL